MSLLASFLAIILLQLTKLWVNYYIFLTLPDFYLAVTISKNSWLLDDISLS